MKNSLSYIVLRTFLRTFRDRKFSSLTLDANGCSAASLRATCASTPPCLVLARCITGVSLCFKKLLTSLVRRLCILRRGNDPRFNSSTRATTLDLYGNVYTSRVFSITHSHSLRVALMHNALTCCHTTTWEYTHTHTHTHIRSKTNRHSTNTARVLSSWRTKWRVQDICCRLE